jgi:predicted DNA-binding protein
MERNGKQAFQVRLPKELIERLDALAGAEHRTRNEQIHHLLDRALASKK